MKPAIYTKPFQIQHLGACIVVIEVASGEYQSVTGGIEVPTNYWEESLVP